MSTLKTTLKKDYPMTVAADIILRCGERNEELKFQLEQKSQELLNLKKQLKAANDQNKQIREDVKAAKPNEEAKLQNAKLRKENEELKAINKSRGNKITSLMKTVKELSNDNLSVKIEDGGVISDDNAKVSPTSSNQSMNSMNYSPKSYNNQDKNDDKEFNNEEFNNGVKDDEEDKQFMELIRLQENASTRVVNLNILTKQQTKNPIKPIGQKPN